MEPPASRQRQPQLQTDQGLAGPIPELTYTLQEAKDAIDTIVWHDHNVQHSLTADGGYTTSLELESKPPEDLVDALYEEMPGDYTGVIAYYQGKRRGRRKAFPLTTRASPNACGIYMRARRIRSGRWIENIDIFTSRKDD